MWRQPGPIHGGTIASTGGARDENFGYCRSSATRRSQSDQVDRRAAFPPIRFATDRPDGQEQEFIWENHERVGVSLCLAEVCWGVALRWCSPGEAQALRFSTGPTSSSAAPASITRERSISATSMPGIRALRRRE